MRRWLPLGALSLLLTSCALTPADPFVAAESALRRDDLLQSLRAFDSVPVAHPRYPEARASASAVERRIRRCHEFLLEALMLRGEWRDEEALQALRRAQEQWPRQPSLDHWIAATEQRLQLFGDKRPKVAAAPEQKPAVPHVELKPDANAASEGEQGVEPGPVSRAETAAAKPEPVVREPVVENVPKAVRQPVAVVVESEPPSTPAAAGESQPERAPERPRTAPRDTVAVPNKPVAPTPVTNRVRRSPTGEDPVALGMVTVEARLHRGELAAAVGDLIELSRRFPDDRRVQKRLAPLLNQRALMHYGQGAVAQAITDWRRVLELEPGNKRVEALLQRALGEQRD